MFFIEFWLQSWKRLLQNCGRRDGKGRALARRHIAAAAGTAYFPGPDSRFGSALSIILCRNAGLCAYPADTCSCCHACRRSCARSSYRRTNACTSRHRTSTRAGINPPSTNPRSRSSGAEARGERTRVLVVLPNHWTTQSRDSVVQ